ncbi:MAG: hypothetical protein ABID09_00115, partial [Candidatus Omnitrophota bacterium]
MDFIKSKYPDKVDLFRSLLKATFNGTFKDFITDTIQGDEEGKDLALHNARVREAIKESGVNLDSWLSYSHKEDFSFSGLNLIIDPESYIMDTSDLIVKMYRLLPTGRQKEFSIFLKKLSLTISGDKDAKMPLLPIQKTPSDQNRRQILVKTLSSVNFLDKLTKIVNYYDSKLRDSIEIKEAIGHLRNSVADLKKLIVDPDVVKELAKKSRRFTIKVWDRSPGHDLFLGDLTGCCMATNSNTHFEAMIDHLIDQGIQVAEVIDRDTDKTVALAWLFLARDEQSRPYLVIDNIEVNDNYSGIDPLKDGIKKALIDYTIRYAQNIGVKTVLAGPFEYSKVNLIKRDKYGKGDYIRKDKFKLEKIGGYYGAKYYLETLEKNESHVIAEDIPIVPPQMVKQRPPIIQPSIVATPATATAGTREELQRRFEAFKLSARKGDWVVKFDGPRIGATNDMYGSEATDWFVAEIIKDTIADFAVQNNIPAEVGGKGSDEFTLCFSSELSENDIRTKMDALMQSFKDRSGRYLVYTVNTKLSADQIAGLKAEGAAFVYSVGVEDQGKVRTKIIFDKKMEYKIRDLLRLDEQAVESIEGLRIPYPVSAVIRLADSGKEYFDQAYQAADRLQGETKNMPIEDGGELVIFEPPAIRPEKELAQVELKVDSSDRVKIEESLSRKAQSLSSTPYVVEKIYGAYDRYSLGRVLADLRKTPLSERVAGTYFIRAPPNEFYVIDVKADGSFELIKFDTLFFASDPMMAEQFNRILSNGRAPFNAKFDSRDMFGFKAINTVFGHDGGSFVIKAIRYSIDNAFRENENAPLEEKAVLAAKELNRIFKSSGFGGYVMASQITEEEAADDTGYKDFVDSAVVRVDDLLRARDVWIPAVIGGNSMVKRHSEYKHMDREHEVAVRALSTLPIEP